MARWGASAFPTGLTPKETAAVRLPPVGHGARPDHLRQGRHVRLGPAGRRARRPHIWQPFYRDSPDTPDTPLFRHGATYAGHATACAVALRNLDLTEEDKLLPRVTEPEQLLARELHGLTA
jgi:hypothetical protein